jgi:hypothetical protein
VAAKRLYTVFVRVQSRRILNADSCVQQAMVLLDKSFLNTFLTPTAPLLISRFADVASWCGHEQMQFN